MGKKKQPDFQKTKLRVGRTLPRGQNVTDTSFKTKKIITRDQLKQNPGEVSLKELLNYLGNHNVSTKKETLHKLKNYVLEKKDTLAMFFPDLLRKIGKILQEDDAGVRDLAIELIHTCLKHLSDTQIECFMEILASYVKCMMTHSTIAIRKDSLMLLDKILDTHPNVMCHFVGIISHLVDLISYYERTPSKGRKRKLDELISSSMTSQDWRIEVLKRICVFLARALNVKDENEGGEEQVVYWSAEKPLFLPIYLRGGLAPVPFESLNGASEDVELTKFQEFAHDLVPLLSDILRGEIPTRRVVVSSVIDPTVVTRLNVIIRVLTCLAEYMCRKSKSIILQDIEFFKLLHVIVCRQLLERFPYSHHGSANIKKKKEKNDRSECMQLNLGVCYLYCLLIFDSDYASFHVEKNITDYLDSVFHACSSMCDESISMMLKICKIFISSSKVNTSFKDGILCGLNNILEVHKLSLLAESLRSFFIDVSLNYDLKHLLESEGMKVWFKVILKELMFMRESGVLDYKFLKYIRQICTRKCSHFLEQLNKSKPKDLLDLLQNKDEEFQLTILHLIITYDRKAALFQDLAKILSDPSFSLKTAVRMVNLLHSRYCGKDVCGKDKLIFLRFLMNLSCDAYMLNDYSWKNEKCSETLLTLHDECQISVRPSSKWKRHSKLTEVCFECLPAYMAVEFFTQCIIVFIRSVFGEYTCFPVHSVLAFLKLRKLVYQIYQDQYIVGIYSELLFSCGLYLSIMINEYKEDGLEDYAIHELQNSLQLERDDAADLIHIINHNSFDFSCNDLFHVLRFMLYLIQTKILQFQDRDEIIELVQKTNSNCQVSNRLRPLWKSICKFFHFI